MNRTSYWLNRIALLDGGQATWLRHKHRGEFYHAHHPLYMTQTSKKSGFANHERLSLKNHWHARAGKCARFIASPVASSPRTEMAATIQQHFPQKKNESHAQKGVSKTTPVENPTALFNIKHLTASKAAAGEFKL